MTQTHHLLLVNGSIYTMDPSNPVAEALLIHRGRVLYAGKNSIARELADQLAVKESFDLELLKEGEDLLVNFVIFLDFGEFVAAAPEEGRRGSLQKVDVQIRADVFREIYIFMFQKAVDAVAHSVYFPGAPVLCRLENAGKAGIDDGGGAAGLADDDISLHGKSSVWF